MRKNLLFTILLIAAFLCGMYFKQSKQSQENKNIEPPRVFIEQLKTKMNITKNHEDVEIFLNGKKMTEDVKIDVKK